MEWKEMVKKHENDFAEFQDKMFELWMKAKEAGEMTLKRLEDFQKMYDETYASYMKETYKEAVFSYQKESLKQNEKDKIRELAKQYPGVDYFQNRLSEMTGIDHTKQKYKEEKEKDDR